MDCQTENGQTDDILRVELEDLKRYANELNLNEGEGMTQLHLAAKKGNKMLTKHFIDEGCCVNAQTSSGVTPLVMAMESGHFEIADILLRANAQLPVSQDSVESAFYMILTNVLIVPEYVCKRFYEAMKSTKSLMQIVALIEELNCPLQGVVAMQDAELTKTILERLEELDETESSDSMDLAVKLLDGPNIEMLMYYGPNVRPAELCFFERLKEIALGGKENWKSLSFLIKRIPDWYIWDQNTTGNIGTIFEKADEEVLTIFMQHNVHLRIKNQSNIDILAHSFGNANSGVMNMMEKLIEDGYSPKLGVGGKSGLHFAVKACNNQNIALQGKDVSRNLRDAIGRTPLFEIFDCKEDIINKLRCIVELLLYPGVDVQVIDKFGMSLLDFHQREGDTVDDVTKTSLMKTAILAHLVMLESKGHSVDERIRQKINSTELYAKYYAKCQQQLEDMKKTRLCSGVTTYTLLTANLFESKLWVRNEALKLISDESYLSSFHPYYVVRLRFQAIQFMLMNIGRNNLSSIICECFEILAPYPLIVDKIISHFPIHYVELFATMSV